MCCRASKAALLLFLLPAPAGASSEEELFFKGTSQVNDGELRFLPPESADPAPDRPIHRQQNRITITRASLESGWIRLEQCHSHLDPVPSLQIVFREGGVRALRLTRSENIERAWVAGPTVQMVNVAPSAQLCLEAETRALTGDASSGYRLNNGPFMRRFLDGYYPMRVSQEVILAAPIRFLDITPPPQPGFRLELSPGRVRFDAVFEGELRTSMGFAAPDQ